jgi:hypothetical protein
VKTAPSGPSREPAIPPLITRNDRDATFMDASPASWSPAKYWIRPSWPYIRKWTSGLKLIYTYASQVYLPLRCPRTGTPLARPSSNSSLCSDQMLRKFCSTLSASALLSKTCTQRPLSCARTGIPSTILMSLWSAVWELGDGLVTVSLGEGSFVANTRSVEIWFPRRSQPGGSLPTSCRPVRMRGPMTSLALIDSALIDRECKMEVCWNMGRSGRKVK